MRSNIKQSVRVDKLLEHCDSTYAAVLITAKRARQITNAKHESDDVFNPHAPALLGDSDNAVTAALRELAEGKLNYSYRN